MKCEEIEELLPDYIAGRLNSDRAVAVEEHIAHCAQCGEEVEIWKKLALLPQEQPSAALRARFQSMQESYQEGRWEKASLAAERKKFLGFGELLHWMRTPSLSAAWACALLVIGFLGGRYIERERSNDERMQIAALQTELHKTSQLVAISLLKQQSASERLDGVNRTAQLAPDPQILDALQNTLRYDTSVDVRLAALDALGRYGRRPDVSRVLVDALEAQQSPLVQVALIDVLVDMHESNAIGALKRLQQESDVNPAVRQKANEGIKRLS